MHAMIFGSGGHTFGKSAFLNQELQPRLHIWREEDGQEELLLQLDSHTSRVNWLPGETPIKRQIGCFSMSCPLTSVIRQGLDLPFGAQ